MLVTQIGGLITLLMTTHEPPSSSRNASSPQQGTPTCPKMCGTLNEGQQAGRGSPVEMVPIRPERLTSSNISH